jgi:hypothetical protein
MSSERDVIERLRYVRSKQFPTAPTGRGTRVAPLLFHVFDDRIGRIASEVSDFDRELRRAAAIASTPRWGESLTRLPNPLALDRNSPRNLDSEAGSGVFLLQVVAEVEAILLSNPLQALLTAHSLYLAGGRARAWYDKAIAGFDGLRRTRELGEHPDPVLGPAEVEYDLPGGGRIRSRGRRIVHQRIHADGSRDVFIIEG